MKALSGSGVGRVSLFGCVECAEVGAAPSCGDLGLEPPARPLDDALVRVLARLFLATIPCVLGSGADAEVPPPVIGLVAVNVVYLLPVFGTHDHAVKEFLAAVCARPERSPDRNNSAGRSGVPLDPLQYAAVLWRNHRCVPACDCNECMVSALAGDGFAFCPGCLALVGGGH